MLGGAGGAGSPGGGELLTVTIVRDEHGYGMKVSGDNPVYVQSVKEHGAAWRAGLRAGDRILRVDAVPVLHHTHQQVVHMIRANPTTVLTVQQNASRHKTPITAPVPVNPEKQRQLEVSKVHTVRLMLEQEQKYIRDLRNELSKVPDVRKQAQLESAEQRCATLQNEIDAILAGQPEVTTPAPHTPRPRKNQDKLTPGSPPHNTGFLSGLPRSLSNLTGQSLRNLRQARQAKPQQENQPPLIRQNSDESGRRKHVHNNTVPMVPTTCLDNSPPPLPPRSIERPKRNPLTPPLNPLAKPKPCSSASPVHNQYRRYPDFPMHQSVPAYNDNAKQLRRSSHSLDGELDGPQPNSIALQMNYPLVNAPPPPLQTDNRGNVPIMHVRSQSSPEHLDHELSRRSAPPAPPGSGDKEAWERGTPPPGTPPPPYAHNSQPVADPQRAIISMEEDDSPASDNSTYSGLFSNLRSVRESRAKTAVLLNWLLGERRCACANLLLIITDGYRAASGVSCATLRRWAYEIQSTFLMPNAVLQLNGVDENMANEIEQVLVNEYEKEELLRNVFRKARQKAKEELSQQLSEFQVKRQVGLGTLYGPEDAVIDRCLVDRAQEVIVVERLLCQRLDSIAGGACSACASGKEAHAALLAATISAALCLHCRPAAVAAAAGGARAAFLQRDKLYKQRVKQLAKHAPQPYVVRGHHLQLQALTSVAHCHHCENVIWGLAPQAYVCTDCKLRVHRACAKSVEESCCLDGEHHNNRISRFMERIHANQPNNQDSNDKKSKKASSTGHFLNMERSYRKLEDESNWEPSLGPSAQERRDESDESLYESADCQSDAISASDDALPRLGKTPTMSKESLKLAITDEEVDLSKSKKGHRKTMSLSNTLEIIKNVGDEWFDHNKKELEKISDRKKSRESLWSEEERDSIHGSSLKLNERKNSKKDDKSQSSSRKSSGADLSKPRKSSKTSALSFLRRKKTQSVPAKATETVVEVVDKVISTEELLTYTRLFLEEEKRHASFDEVEKKPVEETDSETDYPSPKVVGDHRRRLSRQTSRSKSKVRGKSQTVKVNTLRKSHSGTLKKNKKKTCKTPLAGRSRQASIVETPVLNKKSSDSSKQNSWIFSSSKGEPRREGSTEESPAPDADLDANDNVSKDATDKDSNWRTAVSNSSGRGVNRAESCRERDAPRRGKHRNASDPNRLTAHNHHDLEPGAATAPSGSSSSSSLSSRSNESNTVAADQQASQSDWSEEDEPLAAQWADSLPPHVLDTLLLSARLRKRQEVIHELIVSEGSHNRWLKVLGSVFLRPLEGQPSLLPPEELKALFPNLPSVRERHAKLYADLRAARNEATDHIVKIRPIADALLNTLGDGGYASCLSRFCRSQRLALDSLKERRRKNKELQQFLSSREQMPLCARLQLRDLLACVWQRLTKYQLLLESILKTTEGEGEGEGQGEGTEGGESAEDIARLRRALDTAKDVLQCVDAAVRKAENDHRLRTIQSKLEVRAPAGGEWDELRRLELAGRALRHEGELSLRNDSNKKIHVLALMLEEWLVLLQREGDRFLLRPIAQPSAQGVLSPLIKWEKVLFRPNAAVKNTFFLMNINGVQMHELSASTHSEYATWVKHIQELPLAKPELKPSLTPSHQPSRSTDDSGINVSRNPSDASEKSNSTVPEDECERDRASSGGEREKDSNNDGREEAKEREDKHKPRRPTVGRISTHAAAGAEGAEGAEGAAALVEARQAVRVAPPAPAAAAETALSHHERLRRLDESISLALRAKCEVVGELLGAPRGSFAELADLAVADTLGHIDVNSELQATRLSRSSSTEEAPPLPASAPPDMYQLLLAAQAQANQLTETLSQALTVNEAGVAEARVRSRCDRCRLRPARTTDTESHTRLETTIEEATAKLAECVAAEEGPAPPEPPAPPAPGAPAPACPGDPAEALESNLSGAALASRLVSASCALQATLARVLCALPALEARRAELRRGRAAQRDSQDAALARHIGLMTDEDFCSKEDLDQTIQDQPSNGG